MADVKISALPSLAQVDVDVVNDLLPIVNINLPLTQNVTPNDLVKAVLASPGAIGAGTPSTAVFTTLTAARLTSTTYVKSSSTTVGSLGSAATAGAGARWFVTDANATTFASIVAGGGANAVPVYSDGTDWRIG